MPVTAIAPYDFPSSSRAELFGDDQLVHVWWRGNPWFCAAACFRAPKAMSWADFRATLLDPWAAADPDFEAGTPWSFSVDGRPVQPAAGQTLVELGVGHKSLIEFHR